MRSRYIYDKSGNVIFAQEGDKIIKNRLPKQKDAGFHVIKDCEPFVSMVDGSIITSKSRYREHLRQHGCIEVGNDSSVLNPKREHLKPPPGLKETIIRSVNQVLNRRP